MKYALGKRTLARLVILSIAVFGLAALSTARTPTTATSVNIVNSSSREIRNLYQSHVNADDWSGNLLGNATIPAGQSLTVSNIACDQQQVRIIGEDGDGCFVYTVVSCDSSATWTVTNDTARDCGN